jgi:hypothetical protein
MLNTKPKGRASSLVPVSKWDLFGGTIDMQRRSSFSTKTFSGSAGIGYREFRKGKRLFQWKLLSKKVHTTSAHYRKAHNYKKEW